jgi:hypothetical protein
MRKYLLTIEKKYDMKSEKFKGFLFLFGTYTFLFLFCFSFIDINWKNGALNNIKPFISALWMVRN